MNRYPEPEKLPRRSLIMMGISLVGVLITTAYFVFTQPGVQQYQTIGPVKEYRCTKCGRRNVLNNPMRHMTTLNKDNSANFTPVITHLGHGQYTPIIHTKRLTLREITMDDVDAIHEYYSSSEAMLSSNSKPHTSIEETRKMIADMRRKYKTGQVAHWAICLKEGTVIGMGGYHGIVSTHHRATVGWSINHNYWGRGYATEVGHALIEYGFKHLHLNRIDAVVRVDNIASNRVLEKMGLTCTNRFRDFWRVKEELSTFHQFVILKKSVTEQLKRSILA